MRHLRILGYVDEVARTGSIRKAAGQLNVTSSAVNRRILDLEEELGTPLFERRPRGVRLTAAGELFVHYLREQTAEVDRLKSQIEDLKGMRRGTVRIACSQALALDFLPRQIGAFRARNPHVEFDVKVLDHEQAMTALSAYEVDLVLVFRPPYVANFRPIMVLEQRLVAIMAADHPLAAKPSVRFRDCAAHPVALADRSIGGRQLLDEVAGRAGVAFRIVAQSNSFEMLRGLVLHDRAISFQIRIGAMADDNALGIVAREIDEREVPKANLVLGQLRDRSLPVATAIFAERLIRALETEPAKASAKPAQQAPRKSPAKARLSSPA